MSSSPGPSPGAPLPASDPFPTAPPAPGYKRRRLQGSCDMCKRKKIKCDSAKMPDRCSNCIAFDYACTHNTAKRVTSNRKPDYESAHSSVGQVFNQFRSTRDLILSILSNPNSDKLVPTEPKITKQQLLELAVYARHLEHELQSKSATAPPSLTASAVIASEAARSSSPGINAPSPPTELFVPSTETEPSSDQADRPFDHRVEELAGSFDRLVFDGELGATDSNLANAANNRKGDPFMPLQITQKRPKFWKTEPWLRESTADLPPFIFPSSDLLWTLIGCYFENVNMYIPILHRTTFEKHVAEGLHATDRNFGQCLLAVCALGSKFCEDPRVLLEDVSDPELVQFSAGHRFFAQIDLTLCIKRSFGVGMSVSVHELQTICLLIYYLQGTSLVPTSYALLGVAIRLAHSVGAHKTGGKLTVERELYKRCFWTLIFLDTLLSATSGRPRATNPNDYDLDMIIEVDDEYWEHPDETQAFKQPIGKPSKATMFVHFIKLFDILGYAQRTIYSVRRARYNKDEEWAANTLRQMNGALDKWKASIPDFLSWDPVRQDTIFFNQSAFLQSTAKAVEIEINSPFITAVNGSQLAASCLATATHGARNAISILDCQVRRGFLPALASQVTTFISAMILVISSWDRQRSGLRTDPKVDIENVKKSISVLKVYERRWQGAGRMADIISQLLFYGENDQVPLYQPSNLKRPRNDAEDDLLADFYQSPTSAADYISSGFVAPLPTDYLGVQYLSGGLGQSPMEPMDFAAMMHSNFFNPNPANVMQPLQSSLHSSSGYTNTQEPLFTSPISNENFGQVQSNPLGRTSFAFDFTYPTSI